MIKNNNKLFITFDIAIAASLVTVGHKVQKIDKRNPKKASFIFISSDELNQSIQDYWNDELNINARSLLDAIRMIKARLYNQDSCN